MTDPGPDAPTPSSGPRSGPATGPPGSRTFSLADRPAPSLYLIGWLASAGGLALIFVALLSNVPAVGPFLAFAGVLMLGVGLAFAAGYQLVARSPRPPQAYRGPSPLIVFGIVLCVSTVGSGVTLLAGLDPQRPLGFLISLAVIGLAYLGTVVVFVVRGGALGWPEMGWPAWRRPFSVRRMLGDVGYSVAVIVPTTFAALLVGGLLSQVFRVTPPQILPETVTTSESAAVAVAAALVAPIGEELFFRGFALTAWLRDLGPRSALVRSSVFFAIVHLANIQAATFGEGLAQAVVQSGVILPLGFVIGVLFLHRGLLTAMAGHITYNSLLLVLFFAAQPTSPPA